MKANFNSPLDLSSNQKKVKVCGPLVWEQDNVDRICVKNVQITQGDVVATGASGEFKRGDGDQWWCDVDTHDDATLAPGLATASGIVRRTRPGPEIDVFPWSQAVFLQ
jgi:hypothetical protein